MRQDQVVGNLRTGNTLPGRQHIHGFTTMQDAIMKLFGRLPKGGEGAARLQTLLFSATLHAPEIRELATKICQNPVFIDLKV